MVGHDPIEYGKNGSVIMGALTMDKLVALCKNGSNLEINWRLAGRRIGESGALCRGVAARLPSPSLLRSYALRGSSSLREVVGCAVRGGGGDWADGWCGRCVEGDVLE